MRIRQLHINRFGHFNECDLAFPGDGLQVIYGPNEAGKTTLLEFLRGLLFDFPTRTPYDFGGQGDMAGVAKLELRDGRAVELRRRKGNRDKVVIKIDGQPTNLDEAGWMRLIDHADRGLFESVFAFGLDQLGLGEASLKHQSIQSALYGGGLGGTTSPEKIVAELSRQAEGLFNKRASKPTINALMAKLKQLANAIKDRLLHPKRYREVEKAATDAGTRAKGLHDDVDRLLTQHAKVGKQVQAWPKWWELQQRRGQRTQLTFPEGTPVDARQKYVELSNELKGLVAQSDASEGVVKQTQNLLDELKLDPSAILHRAEIKACLELRQSYLDAKSDLPERERNRADIQRQIDRELAELRPGWSYDDLRAFSVDVATRTEIDRLSDDFRKLMTANDKLSDKQVEDSKRLKEAQAELAEIGPQRDVADIELLLGSEADFVANQKQLESTRLELSKIQRSLESQRRKLSPPLPAATSAPHELLTPRVETVADFKSRFDEFRENLRSELKSVDDDECEREAIEDELAVAMSSRQVPTLEERDVARLRRNAGWDLIRKKHISNEDADAAIATWLDGGAAALLPETYEDAVVRADSLADAIYDNANEVAKREEMRRRHAAVTKRIAQKRTTIADFEKKRDGLDDEWRTLWQACGFVPLAPDAMNGWLQDHKIVCATIESLEESTQRISTLEQQVTSFERSLRSSCDLDDSDAAGLLASAHRLVSVVSEQRRRANELQEEVRMLEKQIENHRIESERLAKRDLTIRANWQAVLSRLHLPVDWDTELASKVISGLTNTRLRLDGLPGEAERIQAMEDRIAEFDRRVHSLIETIDSQLLLDPAELAIKKLDEHVDRAVEAQRLHKEHSRTIENARTELIKFATRRTGCESERSGLFALAEAATEAEFLDVVTRAENAARLDSEISQLQRDVDLIRAGDDHDEFERCLANGELELLQGQQRDVSERLKTAKQSRTEADGAEALAIDALKRLDGSADTAILAEQLAHTRAQLAAEVDRYMPLVYARHLLTASVARFERENQPQLIATVSRLLGQMTAGRYVEFDRTSGSNQTILVRRSDGVERTPAQLSTGTREQLYLAIRLAYVLHYCEQNQPLPIIIDDVLVNFDDQRAKQTLMTLADISQSAQVLFFTCHTHMVDIARQVVPGISPIELPETQMTQVAG